MKLGVKEWSPVIQPMKSFYSGENIMGKEENTGYQNCLLFPNVNKKRLFSVIRCHDCEVKN